MLTQFPMKKITKRMDSEWFFVRQYLSVLDYLPCACNPVFWDAIMHVFEVIDSIDPSFDCDEFIGDYVVCEGLVKCVDSDT